MGLDEAPKRVDNEAPLVSEVVPPRSSTLAARSPAQTHPCPEELPNAVYTPPVDAPSGVRYHDRRMALPDLVKYSADRKLRAFCERRVPLHVRDQIKLVCKFRGNSVTLIETRPYFKDPSVWIEHPVAQFRFNLDETLWRLYCRDRNARWHFYELALPSASLDPLIAEVDRDPTCIFWG